ncbi:MAG TPA: dienelactone hydrolase family protein [Candidatus Cybelea sp.]|jgi:dienelactone hydrolase|nr:dienelactone hydrolase family protein [Candidatus Cybelea sp.]
MKMPSPCDFNANSTAFQYFRPWTRCTAAYGSRVPPVFTAGDGPPVVILHEINGASPALFAFAHRVALRGFSAFVPVLFGTPNSHPTQLDKIVQTVRVCLGREFNCLSAHRSSPIIDWVRQLGTCVYREARLQDPKVGGIGVVGLCLTGNFALAMAADEHLLAAVVSEPALPFPIPWQPENRSALGLCEAEEAALRKRLQRGMEIAAFRFANDPVVPLERMSRLHEVAAECGSRVVGNANVPPTCPDAHSVFTSQFNQKDQDSRDAFETLIAFLTSKLAY